MNPNNEMSFAPALCNRIIRNTGGIVIAAKNAQSLRILNEKIKERQIEKKYLLVTRNPKKQTRFSEGSIRKEWRYQHRYRTKQVK